MTVLQSASQQAAYQHNGSNGSTIRQIDGVGASSHSKDDGDSNLSHKSKAGSADQQCSAPNFVDNEDGDDGCNQLDTIDDDSCNEGAFIARSQGVHTSKDLRSKEGNSVDSRPLPAEETWLVTTPANSSECYQKVTSTT